MSTLLDVLSYLIVGLGMMKLVGIRSLVPFRWCTCGRNDRQIAKLMAERSAEALYYERLDAIERTKA